MYSTTDHFILGQVFMENFYVTYDASNPEQHRLGLSFNVDVEAGKEDKNLTFAIAFILITVSVLLMIGVTLTVCLCVRKRQQDRLAKAKAYFQALVTHDEEPDGRSLDETIDEDDDQDGKELEQD